MREITHTILEIDLLVCSCSCSATHEKSWNQNSPAMILMRDDAVEIYQYFWTLFGFQAIFMTFSDFRNWIPGWKISISDERVQPETYWKVGDSGLKKNNVHYYKRGYFYTY